MLLYQLCDVFFTVGGKFLGLVLIKSFNGLISKN